MSSLLDNEIKEDIHLKSYLTFELDREIFGVEVQKVVEIHELTHITAIPNAPAHMAGLLNLRGKILPLIDTKVKFGLPPIVPTVDTCIVVIEMVLEGESMLVGTLVDSVQEVLMVAEEEIQSSPSIDAKFDLEYITGMFKQRDQFILLLNLEKVFALEDQTNYVINETAKRS
ncbi:hypothetical protein BFP72_05815 [Reichenbachiella sp. 5M10]|uniref:chemotaxis protein CheW n=1 Tax=Reichenbachiella sp. 5M10 TaxID=1889772 RepID=UPI000C14A45D|nr:chemotaxis protein CheW [Reichenbachiella sp. 5M10]PIB34944.1 hypothetical protein BFP72_05815 [Reichenbachiella sp. 5M10]